MSQKLIGGLMLVYSESWIRRKQEARFFRQVQTAVPGCCGGRTQPGRRTLAWFPCACHCAGRSSGVSHPAQCDSGFVLHPAKT